MEDYSIGRYSCLKDTNNPCMKKCCLYERRLCHLNCRLKDIPYYCVVHNNAITEWQEEGKDIIPIRDNRPNESRPSIGI